MEGIDRYEAHLEMARILLGEPEYLPNFKTAALWKGKDAKWAIRRWMRRRRAAQLRDRPKFFVFASLEGFEGRLRTNAYVRAWTRANHLIDPIVQCQQQESNNGESQI